MIHIAKISFARNTNPIQSAGRRFSGHEAAGVRMQESRSKLERKRE